jgi:hypothetical protein
MDDVVMVEIPVSREAAEALADADKRSRVGKLVSGLLHPRSPGEDPLAALFAETKRAARAAGLTDEDIDAELAAYNAERRI